MPRKNDNERPIETATIPNLVDICADEEGKPSFLVLDNWTLDAHSSLQIDDKTYVPPPRNAMPWLLPRADEVARYFHSDTDSKLICDVEAAIRANSELPDDRLYPFLAAWVLHTHLIDSFNYSPIIIFYAAAERGKTRTCRMLLSMARRGVHVESLREADIIRKAERFGCTFIFDIMDVWQKAERMGAEDILLGRFDKGMTVSRVTKPEINGFGDTQHFSCFGPTLIASNEPAHRILDSRGILITMRQATRCFDNDPREQDFLSLRERATALRARWMSKEMPDVAKPAANRLGDIIRPLAQVMQAIAPEKLGTLTAYVHTIQQEKADSLADTPEGSLIEAMIDLNDAVLGGKIETKAIATKLNEGRNERYHITPYTVGKKLAALGFKSARILGQKRGIFYDVELLDRLARQYGHAPENDVTSGVSGYVSEDEGEKKRQMIDSTAPDEMQPVTDVVSNHQHNLIYRPISPEISTQTTDTTDAPDSQHAHHEKWDEESLARYADTFKRKSSPPSSSSEEYMPEPDLPEGF